MKNGFLAGVLLCLLMGCSHYSNSPYGSRQDPRNTPCDATPPNQPGCYDNARQEGLLNRLFDAD